MNEQNVKTRRSLLWRKKEISLLDNQEDLLQ